MRKTQKGNIYIIFVVEHNGEASKVPKNNTMKAQVTQDFQQGTHYHELFPSKDKSDLTAQIQFIGHEYLGHNYYVSRDGFESFLLTTVAAGNTKILIRGTVRTLHPGQILFLDCLEGQHSWAVPGPEGKPVSLELYYLHLYPTNWIRSVHRYLTQNDEILDLDGATIGFKTMVSDFIEQIEKGTFDEWAASLRIYDFFHRLIQVCENRNEAGVPEVIERCINYISEHYQERILLADLAEEVSLSRNYLEALFTKSMGQSLYAYIGNYRFQKSADLLIQTNESVEDIAAQVGLSERKALIRLFKKNLGMTPLAYRKFYNQAHPVPKNTLNSK